MHRFQKWRDVLTVAPDEKTVAAVMRDYVKVIDPKSLEQMPPECRKALDGSVDLQAAAVALLHAELMYRGSPEMQQLLHEVAHTFAAASIRMSRLRMEPILPAAPE